MIKIQFSISALCTLHMFVAFTQAYYKKVFDASPADMKFNKKHKYHLHEQRSTHCYNFAA